MKLPKWMPFYSCLDMLTLFNMLAYLSCVWLGTCSLEINKSTLHNLCVFLATRSMKTLNHTDVTAWKRVPQCWLFVHEFAVTDVLSFEYVFPWSLCMLLWKQPVDELNPCQVLMTAYYFVIKIYDQQMFNLCDQIWFNQRRWLCAPQATTRPPPFTSMN